MNKLDKIARAKMYLDKLANGINPLTDEDVAINDVVNNVRISRCMFYVSDILRQILDNKGKFKVEMPDKSPFSITAEQLKNYEFSDTPISVTEIARKINSLIDCYSVKELKATNISNWLVEIDMLKNVTNPTGKTAKRPTENGINLGITTESRFSRYGDAYTAVVYNRNAQQFILDNIDAVIHINNQKKTKAKI